jgi:Uma2 family endonuclease
MGFASAWYGFEVPTFAASFSDNVEQRMLLHEISWEQYVKLDELLTDVPGLHLTYCDGDLELMTIGKHHEADRHLVSRLVELYAFLKDIPLYGWGSPTTRKQAQRGGFEPDESYTLGRKLDCDVPIDEVVDFPDIVIEVVVSRPLLNKRKLFHKFSIPEVWVFCDGAFTIYRLTGDRYEAHERSAFLPELDFAWLATLVRMPDQQEALRELKRTLAP